MLDFISSVPHLFLPGGLDKSSFKNKIPVPVFRPAGGFSEKDFTGTPSLNS